MQTRQMPMGPAAPAVEASRMIPPGSEAVAARLMRTWALLERRSVPGNPDVATADLAEQSGQTAGVTSSGPQLADPARWLEAAQSLAGELDERAEGPEAPERSHALVKLVNGLIVDAWQLGASDIHLECPPAPQPVRVRFRRDGVLRTYVELPTALRSALVARIKVMASLDISERRRPQDGRISFGHHVPERPLELRVVTMPTTQGVEDVVMRLLTAASPRPLEALGLQQAVLHGLRNAIEQPHGLILCAGPTGSGKTTTLHALLAALNTPERKIWTAEDPIEITQPGLRQVQVNNRLDWTFDKALRTFLRADPDVIMVGEIRDRDTARLAVAAALTGHLVLSTIHTNSAAETLTRLIDLGVDAFSLADALRAVLGQRLVRRLCPQCRQPNTAAATTSPPREWQAPGCPSCAGTGWSGRIGLHEWLWMDRELRGLVQRQEPASAIQTWAEAHGMRTLRQDGLAKVAAGDTTLDEVRRSSVE